MAGNNATRFSESRQGRKKNMVAVRKDLSSLTGLAIFPNREPSHKWLGLLSERRGARPSRLHRSASRGMEFAENAGSPQGVRRDAGHCRRDARAPRAKTEFGLDCGSTRMPRQRRYAMDDGERNRPGCTVPRLAEWSLRKMLAHRKVSGATPDTAGGTPALLAQRLEFGLGCGSTMMPRRRRYGKIPTGFHHPARRCEERATPGCDHEKIKTPTGFHKRMAK